MDKSWRGAGLFIDSPTRYLRHELDTTISLSRLHAGMRRMYRDRTVITNESAFIDDYAGYRIKTYENVCV